MASGCARRDDDESTTVRRACDGDQGAFAVLVKEHTPALRALAMRSLGDTAAVDDALQEAYIKAFRALPSFRGASTIGSWLYRICQNVCTDELRRRHRAAVVVSDIEPLVATVSGGQERSLDRHLLARAMDRLSPELRAPFLLVDVEGYSYAEAAEALSVPIGTIASRLARGRAVLRRRLATSLPSAA